MSSVELKILNLFIKSRDSCEKYYNYVIKSKNLEKEIKFLFVLTKDYYEKYKESTEIYIQDLKSYYDLVYPISKDKDIYYLLIEEVFGLNINQNVIQDLLEQFLEKHYATYVVNKLIPVIEGSSFGILSELQQVIDEFNGLLKNPPENTSILIPNEKELKDLTSELYNEGLNWHIEELNNIIGRAKRKSLGLIAAFVDTGKTSFGIGAAANFAGQLGEDDCIIYAGNEESANRSNLRLTQALLHKTRTEILENIEQAELERKEKGFNKIKLFDQITGLNDIERLLDEYRPVIMFIDQGTNIDIPAGEEGASGLKRLFREYRNLANKYDTHIICLVQATGECENVKWIKLSDLYGSRVAIQGALDYFIGIGRIIDEPAKENLRYLNIPKNKLLDGKDGKITVNFYPERCLWKQI